MKIEICLTGFSHDDITWPQCKIELDGQVIFEKHIQNDETIVLDNLELNSNNSHTLKILQYGKMFGENRVWHTRVVDEKITKDRFFLIKDIKFDDVSIKRIWHNGQIENNFNKKQIEDFADAIPYVEHIVQGYDEIRISFNGGYVLNFETPVYDWIILTQAPLMKIEGKMKESSLTSIVNWRLDYTRGNALEELYNQCVEILDKIP